MCIEGAACYGALYLGFTRLLAQPRLTFPVLPMSTLHARREICKTKQNTQSINGALLFSPPPSYLFVRIACYISEESRVVLRHASDHLHFRTTALWCNCLRHATTQKSDTCKVKVAGKNDDDVISNIINLFISTRITIKAGAVCCCLLNTVISQLVFFFDHVMYMMLCPLNYAASF